MEEKNESIDNLVDKMKTGDISKTELFSQLSQLYDVSSEPSSEADPVVSTPEPSFETSAEKKKKIENLLENFRATLDEDELGLMDNQQPPENVASSPGKGLDVDSIQMSTERVLKTLKESMNTEFNINPYAEDEVFDQAVEAGRYHEQSAPYESTSKMAASGMKFGRRGGRNLRNSFGPRSRQARIRQLEAIMQANEKKECTFRPEIKKLPNMYVQRDNSKTPIVERLHAWQNRVKASKGLKQAQKNEEELGTCTFKPRLNETSKLLSSSARQDIRNVSLRSQARAKLVEREIRRQAEQSHLEECTFKPKINTNSKQMVKRNKSLQAYNNRSKKNEARVLEDVMKECTFTPQINKVKKSMQAATLYLEMHPFERLSQPQQKYHNDEVWPEDNGTIPSVSASKTNSPRKIKYSVSSPSFLERSKKHLERKRKTVERHLAKENQELYKPRLNKKSVKIIKSNFFDRLERESRKRSMKKTVRDQIKADPGDECTFKPQINIMSQNLKGRSFTEMSEGDVAIKTSRLELARMYARQKELSGVTFKPERKTKNNYWDTMAQSTLKVATEPHNYTERVSQMQARKDSHLRRKQLEREEEELSSCTFRPETKEAPDFVKRIATSMKTMKNSRSSDLGKPGWK